MSQANEPQESVTVAADSDEEIPPPPPQDTEYLSWKLPAEESHSDWTIIINCGNGTETNSCKVKEISRVYHVHKALLSVGPKKSVYFERLFMSPNFTESGTKTSCIELNAVASKAFPLMLDYMYSRHDKLEITTETATAIHYLGQYFEIQRLRWHALQFCTNDLSVDNCGTYYEHAKIFHDDKVLDLVVKKCRDDLKKIGRQSHLMKVSDVPLWRSVIQFIQDGHPDGVVSDSKSLSCVIANFCSVHSDLVDTETFTDLTSSKHMKEIDVEAAIALLRIECSLFPESKTAEQLTSLQVRCLRAITDAWESFDGVLLQRDLGGLNPCLLRRVFIGALSQARTDFSSARKRQKLAEKQLTKRLIVACAGKEESNGAYIRTSSTIKGAPIFEKKNGNGNTCLVALIKRRRDAKRHWYIREKSENGQSTYYYRAKYTEGLLMPPARGWSATDAGIPSVPKLSFSLDE